MKKEEVYKLAILYFEGKISPEEESVLFKFITQNEQHKKLFNTWENEWIQNEERKNTLQKDWNLLQNKIQTRNTIAPIFKINRSSLFRRIAAVAAIVVITISVTIAFYELFSPIPENNLFIVETPNGEKSRITLSDGTVVWLNSSSKITYNSSFGTSDRIIELDGEAYFEVNKQEKIPFRVKTGNYDVVVKGTKFNVSSYQDDHLVTTALMEGKVEIILQDKVFEMLPGELIQMDKETHDFIKTKVNPEQHKSWIDNKIEYDAITLDELFNRLSRQYNVNIHFQANQNDKRVLNISIKNNESIDEILDGISKVTPLQIEKKDKNIYVKIKQ